MNTMNNYKSQNYKYFFHFWQYVLNRKNSLFEDFLQLKELYRLIQEEDIHTFFQPIISLQQHHTIGFEIFNRPSKTEIFPTTEMFYHFVGQSQHVFAVERYFRDLSFRRFSEAVQKQPDNKDKLIFVNIHPKVINDADFRGGETLKLLEKYSLSPKQIVLELTERESVIDYKQFEKTLHHYRSQGYRIAVDDAGTGYNSLKTIVCLQPEFIKLDKSLIRGIYHNKAQQQMVLLLLNYANQTGTEVIAEGIEQKEDLDYLQVIGVHFGQGFSIGKPMVQLASGQL